MPKSIPPRLMAPTFKLFTAVCLGALLLFGPQVAHAQETAQELPILSRGSLEEIRDKRIAHLMVISSTVIDARDPDRGVADAVRENKQPTRRHGRLYADIAKRLNKYIRKYGSMIGTDNAESADFIIVFNLLRYRRQLYGYYPYGEMYVVVARADEPVRILWKSEKEMLSEDATKRLIDALKLFRREK